MRDLDQRHAGVIEAGGNIHHLLDGDLVPHRVHAVAQAHVMQFDLAATDFRFVGHQAASSIGMGVRVILPSRISWANISARSEEHTSELQSLMRTSYDVLCLNKKSNLIKNISKDHKTHTTPDNI